MIDFDLFNDDERQYLNKIAEGMKQEKITRSEVLSVVSFARDVADLSDTGILDLLDGVYSKVSNLSDDEWQELKAQFPFPVNITDEDNVDEVPDDEDVTED